MSDIRKVELRIPDEQEPSKAPEETKVEKGAKIERQWHGYCSRTCYCVTFQT
jgi:hypothetical protein